MLDIRNTLRLDAVASGALGAVVLALAGVLAEPLGLPVLLSVVAGAGLLVWAAFVSWVSARPSPGLVKEVMALNVVWILASVGYALLGSLTGLGIAVVLAQAAAVALLTELQLVALQRTRTAASA